MLTDLITPPLEPISLPEAKSFLRLDHDDEDALITTLIQSARERLESTLNVALIQRPMQVETGISQSVKLPRWPVVSVDSVTLDGEETEHYSARLTCRPVRLSWSNPSESVIQFTAGYGVSPDDIPAPLRQAMLLLVSHAYEHRDAVPDRLPLMVDTLTMPYRVIGL